MVQQAALPLSWHQRYGVDDFVVADCNATAMHRVRYPTDWPVPVFIIQGEANSGKSHLAAIFQKLHDAMNLVTKADIEAALLSESSYFMMDNADRFLQDDDAAESLFHLINHVLHKKARLLLTGATPPTSWARIPDLASRLRAGALVVLEQPSEDMIKASYQKMFMDRGLLVDDKVLDYLAMRSERSFSGIRAIVERLDVLALEQGRKITIPLIQAAGVLQ